ncbi:MAG: agmatinase [Desulfovibrionaceae bacterium]|nr:agmatinase [Desulfovibrionaceae bacterium]
MENSAKNSKLDTNSYLPFLASEYAPKLRNEAKFHIIPIPLEQSVSYGAGTRNGPAAILRASQQLEAWENERFPGKLGFYTGEAIDCSAPIENVLAKISAEVTTTLNLGKIPVLLGGEHTVTLGALRAFYERSNYSRPGLVQFDAHADLRASYEGSPYSHACVMYQAVAEMHFQLVQFGIREYSLGERAQQIKSKVVAHTANALADHGLPTPILPADFPKDIYITFDVDAFDAALMPATGTPAPGGLFWQDVRRILMLLSKERHIVGFDVVELAPITGLHAYDFTAAKLVHFLMSLTCADENLGAVSEFA